MNLFISEAWAQGAGGAQGGGLSLIIMMVLFFGIMYFMLIRPQQKRTRDHRKMIEELAKGDEVVTNGGTLGRITHVGGQFLTVEVAEGVAIKVQKHAVAAVMPKGTIKESA